jgi:hypothetical protein
MAGVIGLGGCCTCGATPCGSPVTLTVNVRCQTSTIPTYSNIASAAVDLKDSGGTVIASTTTNVSGVATFSITTPGDYTVEASKTGYETVSQAVTIACSTTPSVTLITGLTSITVKWSVGLCSGAAIKLANCTIALSGDVTDSGTTDSAGEKTFTITKPTGIAFVDVVAAYTPPSGHGCASATDASRKIWFCTASTTLDAKELSPATGHVSYTCGDSYLPDTLEYDDDYGSCTLSNTGGNTWEGTYVQATTDGINRIDCSGTMRCVAGASGNVTVTVKVFATCSGATWNNTLRRTVKVERARTTCADGTLINRLVIDGTAVCGGVQDVNKTFNVSCSGAVSITESIPAATISGINVPETAVTATVTGTIGG